MENNFNTDYYSDSIYRSYKTKNEKKQIILLNTSIDIESFFTKIQTRYNSKYDKVPTFTISNTGKIYQHFDSHNVSHLFQSLEHDRRSISIALENLGWLTHDEVNNLYFDWRGNICQQSVIETNWRNKKYWAEYTDAQLESLIELIDYLCIEHKILKHFIGHNVLVENAVNFNGILNRSNISKVHYDLTPAFDFEKLTEKLKLIDNVERE